MRNHKNVTLFSQPDLSNSSRMNIEKVVDSFSQVSANKHGKGG